ncbi:MAG: phosphate ABC transporter permease subunit PstC [Thermorudis peleae]|nr:phosphate ABC transporter permease subunit PstC [Thermorudis peleae]
MVQQGEVVGAEALRRRQRDIGDPAFAGAVWITAAGAVLTLALLIALLLHDAWPAIRRYGFGFFVHSTWDPVFEQFGAASFIYGTIVTSLIALILAAPIGIAAALFIVEYAPRWLREPVAFSIEMLAAIPSIVYGLWGLFVLVPVMRNGVEPALQAVLGPIPVLNRLVAGPPIGLDLLTGGVILAIMILPTVMAVSREVILAVPDLQREGMFALGATKWEMIRYAVLPYARAGMIGAAMLGLARALGETMAVTLVVGNSTTQIRASLFTPGYTIASAIANQFTEADKAIYFSALMNLALVLLLVALLINLLARLLVFRFVRSPAGVRV